MIVMAQQVAQFHRTFGHACNGTPSDVSVTELRLRLKLVLEEVVELAQALNTDDAPMWAMMRHHLEQAHGLCDSLEPAKINPVETTDALADLMYVATGMSLVLGLPIVQAFDEVHRSNMSKLDENGKPIFGTDGKIKKGPNYVKPNLAQFFRGANERTNNFLSAWDVVSRAADSVDDVRVGQKAEGAQGNDAVHG